MKSPMLLPSLSAYILIVAGGLLISTCGGSPVEPALDPCVKAQELRGSASFLGVAEEANVAAQVIPGGFGALFQDFGYTNDLLIYLQDPSKTDTAKQALRRLLFCGAAYPGWLDRLVGTDAIQVRQGQYTGSQLLTYSHALAEVRSDPEVWALEVDPETDRIWIGLRSSAALTRIQQAVIGMGVPAGAVNIEVPPPVTGSEPFSVLDSVVITSAHDTANGVFLASAYVRYTNHYAETRYPDNCITVDRSHVSFLYRVEKWDGQAWKKIHDPICESIALAPRGILPAESRTDTVLFVGVRRLRSVPLWQTARISGTYRFIGTVYLSTIPNPPFLANPAPEEQNSTPFRIINRLPF
jgi:hypothetical protein